MYYIGRPGGSEQSRPKGGIGSSLTLLVSSASQLTLALWARDGWEGRGATSVPLLPVLPVLAHFDVFLPDFR